MIHKGRGKGANIGPFSLEIIRGKGANIVGPVTCGKLVSGWGASLKILRGKGANIIGPFTWEEPFNLYTRYQQL